MLAYNKENIIELGKEFAKYSKYLAEKFEKRNCNALANRYWAEYFAFTTLTECIENQDQFYTYANIWLDE